MAIVVHPVHRKLAEITFLNTDVEGNLEIGRAELKLIMPLLRENLEFVRKVDEMKSLALEAQATGDMEWVQEITLQLEEMEATLT